jgi:hypothetical protein
MVLASIVTSVIALNRPAEKGNFMTEWGLVL